jgi:thymidylate kinase
MNKFIIIEGIDNVGKDTQQKLIIKRQPHLTFQTLHYSTLPFNSADFYKSYSAKMYDDMFKMMLGLKDSEISLIFNRSHLGETVYSPLYRDYSGDYIFDIEKEYVNDLKDKLYLITLIGDPNIIQRRDDGLSHSSKLEDIQREVDLFMAAHRKSYIKNKILINIGSMMITEVNDIIMDFLREKNIF